MATDTRADKQLTIADLCQAIAEDEVAYTLRDGEYQVSGAELRRLRRGQPALAADQSDLPLGLLGDAASSASEAGSLA
jgi:hypothetical protein